MKIQGALSYYALPRVPLLFFSLGASSQQSEVTLKHFSYIKNRRNLFSLILTLKWLSGKQLWSQLDLGINPCTYQIFEPQFLI